LASASANLGAAPRRLRLESQGANHRIYFNGVLALSYTEKTYTSGQPGIAASVFGGPAVKILSFTGGAVASDKMPPVGTNTSSCGSVGRKLLQRATPRASFRYRHLVCWARHWRCCGCRSARQLNCNSLDSTLRTALASFYVSDTGVFDWGDFEIGVGIVIAYDPLLGPGRALVSASGSYLG
jgi:hypothetical protein